MAWYFTREIGHLPSESCPTVSPHPFYDITKLSLGCFYCLPSSRSVPPMVQTDGEVPGKVHDMTKKFGSRVGEAAVFGFGATGKGFERYNSTCN